MVNYVDVDDGLCLNFIHYRSAHYCGSNITRNIFHNICIIREIYTIWYIIQMIVITIDSRKEFLSLFQWRVLHQTNNVHKHISTMCITCIPVITKRMHTPVACCSHTLHSLAAAACTHATSRYALPLVRQQTCSNAGYAAVACRRVFKLQERRSLPRRRHGDLQARRAAMTWSSKQRLL